MFRKIASFVVASAAVFGADAANVVYNYIGPTTGSSPVNPVDFTISEYWDRKEAPSGLTSEAVFATGGMGALSDPLYVRLPDNYELAYIRGGGGKLCYFIGGELKIATVGYKDYANPATMVYATVRASGSPENIGFVCAGIAGDIISNDMITFAGGNIYHRHDFYANSDSEEIVNAIPSGYWVQGSGSVIMYAPRPSEEFTALYKATVDSSYLTYSGPSPMHAVSPGAKVSCDGVFPEGTFVRRWFNAAKTIELSNVALKDSDRAEITFHAYNPSVRQSVNILHKQGQNGNVLELNKWNPLQSAVFDITRIAGGEDYMKLGANDSQYPWRYVFHDVSFNKSFRLSNAEIEFGTPPDGMLRGFWKQPVGQCSNSKTSTIIVPESVGYIHSITNSTAGGTLAKKGPGELVTQVLGDLKGAIEVVEGTLTITNCSKKGIIYSAGKLIVRSGATLKLTMPTASVIDIIAEEGATVIYPQMVLFSTVAAAEAFEAPDGVAVGVIGGGAMSSVRLGRNSGLAVEGDDTLSVVEVTGVGGTFTKSGDGVLVLKGIDGALDKLVVGGGKMKLYSRVADKSIVPPVWAHFDAMGDFGTLTQDSPSVHGEGTMSVKKWTSAANADGVSIELNPVCTNHPILKVVQGCTAVPGMNGKTVVDMGAQLYVKDICGSENVGKNPPDGCGYGYLHKYGYSKALVLSKSTGKSREADSVKTMFWVLGSAAGGGVLTGDAGEYGGYNDGWTIMRGAPFVSGDLSKGAVAPIEYANSTYYSPKRKYRLNGKAVDPLTTGFSGSWDVVSAVDADGFGVKAFGQAHYGKWSGGQELGEVIISKEKFTPEQVEDVEAYLLKKWFERDTPGYRAASIGALTLADGAELEVVGASGITVSSVSGGGTVSGNVKAAGPLDVALTVVDGEISPLVLSSEAMDLSEGGRITIAGDVNSVDPGVYDIVVSDKIAASQRWTLTVQGLSRRSYKLIVTNGAIKVSVQKLGLGIIFH